MRSDHVEFSRIMRGEARGLVGEYTRARVVARTAVQPRWANSYEM